MVNQNPLQLDDDLKIRLGKIDSLHTIESYQGWKTSFLDGYKKHVDENGVLNAKDNDERLLKELRKLAKVVTSIHKMVDDGVLAKDKSPGVKGQQLLNELYKEMAECKSEIIFFYSYFFNSIFLSTNTHTTFHLMTFSNLTVEKNVKDYLPTSGQQEEKIGYDKFELGAVLIENDFKIYELMVTTRDLILKLHDKVLQHITTKNNHSIMNFYMRQIQSFVDVMADLGLFFVMEKLLELRNIRPRNKKGRSSLVPTNMPQKPTLDGKENGLNKDGPKGDDAKPKPKFRNSIIDGGYCNPLLPPEEQGGSPGSASWNGKRPSRHSAKGGPRPKSKSVGGDPDDGEEDGEGDEPKFIIYYDPTTQTVGKISRQAIIDAKVIIKLDKDGDETLEGKITNQEEKDQLVFDIKKAMRRSNSGIPKSMNTTRKSKSTSPPR